METKKGPLARQVPFCLNDRACECSSAHLWVPTKHDIYPRAQKEVIYLPSSLSMFRTLFHLKSIFFSCKWSELFFSLPSPTTIVGESGQLWTKLNRPRMCHTQFYYYYYYYFLPFFTVLFSVLVGAKDPWAQSPLCSLSHSHLMTSWLDVCIKQMWLAMRGLKQDRTACSL